MILLAVDVEGLVAGNDRSAARQSPASGRLETAVAGEVVRSRVVPWCERLRGGAAVAAEQRRGEVSIAHSAAMIEPASANALTSRPSFRVTDSFLQFVEVADSVRAAISVRSGASLDYSGSDVQEPLNTNRILGVRDCGCVTLWGGKTAPGDPWIEGNTAAAIRRVGAP